MGFGLRHFTRLAIPFQANWNEFNQRFGVSGFHGIYNANELQKHAEAWTDCGNALLRDSEAEL